MDTTQTLKVSTARVNSYATPTRIPIGSGLSVELPEGEGLTATRWRVAADAVMSSLQELLELHGCALQYRRFRRSDTDLHRANAVEVRITENAMPISTMLGHPTLARELHHSLELYFGEPAVVYLSPDSLLACPAPRADYFPGWLGPMSVESGFCEHVNARST